MTYDTSPTRAVRSVTRIATLLALAICQNPCFAIDIAPARTTQTQKPADEPTTAAPAPDHWVAIQDASTVTTEYLTRLSPHARGISLPHLTMLSDDIAATLAHYRGDVALDALLSIRPRHAWMLATPSDTEFTRVLSLNGLTELDPQSAEAFASHRGGLSLDGLNAITLETTRLLCRTDGVLSLRGLARIDADQATVIASRLSLTLVHERALHSPEAYEIISGSPLARITPLRESHPDASPPTKAKSL